MAFKVETKGLSSLQRFFLNVVPTTKREIKQVTEGAARIGELEAKKRARVDTGKLRQGISFEITNSGYGFTLFSAEPYSIYVEMGTGGLVEVPEGFEDLASSYQGSGKRQINLPARPFMIPAYLIAKEYYLQEVDAALNRIFS